MLANILNLFVVYLPLTTAPAAQNPAVLVVKDLALIMGTYITLIVAQSLIRIGLLIKAGFFNVI